MIQIQDDSVNQIVMPASASVAQASSPSPQSFPASDASSSDRTSEIDQLLAELDKLSKNLEEKPAVKSEVVAEPETVVKTETIVESKPVMEVDSDEKFDFDSFLTDLEKKIDAESQKHQEANSQDVDATDDSTEDFRKNRPALDVQEDGQAEEPKENFVFKKRESIDLNEKNDESDSEELKAQNVFNMLGLMNIDDSDKNQFLDELESMIWEDFITHDLELLLTSEEFVGARQILEDSNKDDDAKKEALIIYLEKLVPDLDEVLYEKALELKSEMMGERLVKMKEGADESVLSKIKEAEDLISQNLWKSATSLLNQLS